MRKGGPLVVSLRRRLAVASMTATAIGLPGLVAAVGVRFSATSGVRAIEGDFRRSDGYLSQDQCNGVITFQ